MISGAAFSLIRFPSYLSKVPDFLVRLQSKKDFPDPGIVDSYVSGSGIKSHCLLPFIDMTTKGDKQKTHIQFTSRYYIR